MPLATPDRRGFLRGLGALLAAPAIVRASSLMAISPIKPYSIVPLFDMDTGLTRGAIRDLLLPGVSVTIYPDFPRQWANVFRNAA